MTAPWGLEPWGLGPWGGGASASIVSAYAISTNEVLVTLAGAPLAITPALYGDALNPTTWQVVDDQNRLLEVLQVTQRSLTEYVLSVLQPLPVATGQAAVSSQTLQNATGGLADLPRSAALQGLTEAAIATPQQKVSTQLRQRDLSNRPAPSADGSLGGTFRISGGDYVLDQGPELTKKMILRRATTEPGAFFHLTTFGFAQRLKEISPAGDLIKRRAEAERQIALEPDVDSVRVSITQSANTVTTTIAARTKSTGAQINGTVTTPIGG